MRRELVQFAARRRRGGAGGFTLLELVVAMGMVAVMAVSLYTSMRIAFRAQASAETALEPVRTAELAFEFLRQDLGGAVPPGGVLAGLFIGTDSQGDTGRAADDLQFYTTADAAEHVSGNGEIKNVELTIATPEGAAGPCLVRRVIRNLLSQVQVNPDEEIVCRGVGALNLRYFDGSAWEDSWNFTEHDTLPTAVEVTLEIDRRDAAGELRTTKFVRVFPIAVGSDQGGIGL